MAGDPADHAVALSRLGDGLEHLVARSRSSGGYRRWEGCDDCLLLFDMAPSFLGNPSGGASRRPRPIHYGLKPLEWAKKEGKRDIAQLLAAAD